MSSSKFNLAALLLTEPNSVFLSFIGTTNSAYYARRSGQSGLFKPVTRARNAFQQNPLYAHAQTGATYTEILAMAHAEKLEFNSSFHVGARREFLQLQLEAHCGAGSVLPTQAQAAHNVFVTSADRLAAALKPVLPGYTAGVKGSLMQSCFAVSKRHDGVFVWPNWRNPGEVFAVVSLPDDKMKDAGAALQSWLEQERITLSPATGFN